MIVADVTVANVIESNSTAVNVNGFLLLRIVFVIYVAVQGGRSLASSVGGNAYIYGIVLSLLLWIVTESILRYSIRRGLEVKCCHCGYVFIGCRAVLLRGTSVEEKCPRCGNVFSVVLEKGRK